MVNENNLIRGLPLESFAYNYAPNLYVITAYYNPMNYATRRKNYEIFAETLRQSGIPLLTIECAFGDQSFTLPESIDVIKVKSESLLWQKERLLNLGISWLPKSCHYVAWLDCDLVFLNPNWARDLITVLDQYPVAQVFETCDRVPQNYHDQDCASDICHSFGKVIDADLSTLFTGRYEDHGHTGYGWAARRDILDKHGLYEHAVAGSADHYMAHAILGNFDGLCIQRQMNQRPQLLRHFREWGEGFYDSVQGKLGVVPGQILHLWHGDLQHRKYGLRMKEFDSLNYNPFEDVIGLPGKALELTSESKKLAFGEWFTNYFLDRQEDGNLVTA